jgi:hypothetical protein
MTDQLTTTGETIEAIEMGFANRDDVLRAMAQVQHCKHAVAALHQRMEAAVIQWIQTNGDLEEGDNRYYVGTEKRTKCVDVKATLTKLLDVTGGDLDAVMACLSTGAFKPAATLEVLGDDGRDLFTTEVVQDLKTGKPKRALKAANKRFTKGADTE